MKVSQSPKSKIMHGEKETENKLALVLLINKDFLCSFFGLYTNILY